MKRLLSQEPLFHLMGSRRCHHSSPHQVLGIFSSTKVTLSRAASAADRPVQHVISRQRTWRGVMQVRSYDGIFGGDTDKKTYYKDLFWNIFVSVPMMFCYLVFGTLGTYYFVVGHDQFMFEIGGYESEMAYEAAVNPHPYARMTHQKEERVKMTQPLSVATEIEMADPDYQGVHPPLERKFARLLKKNDE